LRRVSSRCAVAKRASLPARTVRFYADSGLLKPTAHGKEVDRQVKELAAVREQLIDLAAESDVGCSDAFCLCRTRPDQLVPMKWGKR